jgi:hypothetical protein
LLGNGRSSEFLAGTVTHRLAVHRLDLLNGFQIDRHRSLVFIRFHALLPRWETVYEYSRFTSLHERCTSPHANCRAPSQQDLMHCQRTVIIVR